MILSLAVAGCAHEGRCKLARATQLPLTLEKSHLYVNVEVNGSPAHLAVDTGSGGTVLTAEAVDRLKLMHPTDIEGASIAGIGGFRSVSALRTGHFSLGGLGGNNLDFMVPFGDWWHLPGDGILGMDILSRFDIDFDLPARKMILYVPTEGCNSPSAALEQPLFVLPMHQNSSSARVIIDVTIDGHPLRALLDSGASSNLLFRPATNALGLDAAALEHDKIAVGGGVGQRRVAVHQHVLKQVQIGDLTINNMHADVSDEPSYSDEDMILGVNFFRQVHLWFSYASHSIIVQFPPRASPVE